MSSVRLQTLRPVVELLRAVWTEFQRHNGYWLAGALAYFAALAIAPLIIVLVEIAGFLIHNNGHVLDLIFDYLRRDVGPGATAVYQIVEVMIKERYRGIVFEFAGWAVFVMAAVGLFNAMQFALNTVWGADVRQLTLVQILKQRGWSFLVMLMIALLLLLTLGLNAAITVASAYMEHVYAGLSTFVKLIDFLASIAVVWAGFGLLFAFLPDRRIEWRDVTLGAGITAVFFVVGQFLLGWYLAKPAVSSPYGTFGSFVAFLIWVNYSAQIMLLGAEFTHEYAKRFGSLSRRRQAPELHPG
jgi:membrane protein